MGVNYKPAGYNTVAPYLIVKGAARAIEFYKKIFGAKELIRLDGPNGKIGHAEIQVGDSRVCLADEYPEMGARGPQTIGGSPVNFLIYVPDVDRTVEQAVAAGARLKRPVADQFYGDRMGGVEDPFGHTWYIATHKEDVPPDELQRRSEAMAKEMAKKQ